MRNIVLIAILLLLPTAAFAGWNNEVVDGFQRFVAFFNAAMNRIALSGDFYIATNNEFLLFAGISLATTMTLYARGVVDIGGVFQSLLTILIVKTLMFSYNDITYYCFRYFEGIASVVQTAIIGSGDMFAAPNFVIDVISRIEIRNAWNPLSIGMSIITSASLFVLSIIVAALSSVAILWSVWGYTLAKAIGLLFIPTLLFRPLSWMADSWLRFFFGFLIYGLIARVNLSLFVLTLAAFYDISLNTVFPNATTYNFYYTQPIVWDPESVSTFFNGIVMMVVGVLAIISTGKFASAMVSGAGGGGLSGAISSATGAIAKAARMGL